MLSSLVLPRVRASASLVTAVPPQVRPYFGQGANDELRLIKTSATDPGTWVTEEQKITDYVSKDIHFIDITDIKVSFLLIHESVYN
jgi:leucyl aminopeptidase